MGALVRRSVNRKVGRIITAILRPAVTLIGIVAAPVYDRLFAKSDQTLAIRHENELIQDIRNKMPYLLHDLQGCILPSVDGHNPAPFDYAIVNVQTRDFRLRFTRGRQTLTVQAAPHHAPSNWHELSTILAALELQDVQRGSISDLAKANEVLRNHFADITHALGTTEFAHTLEKLNQIYVRDRVVAKQLETEINRRLYPD